MTGIVALDGREDHKSQDQLTLSRRKLPCRVTGGPAGDSLLVLTDVGVEKLVL
jgi:hypothetical protein